MAAPKNASPTQVIHRLRKAEVRLANGKPVKGVCKGLGISEQTDYRWRREYGGMTAAQAKKLKEPENEEQRLKKAVTDFTLHNLILKEAAKGNF